MKGFASRKASQSALPSTNSGEWGGALNERCKFQTWVQELSWRQFGDVLKTYLLLRFLKHWADLEGHLGSPRVPKGAIRTTHFDPLVDHSV